jgi:quinol-cytochrome oxidoreductase complex cytochrome b subunit
MFRRSFYIFLVALAVILGGNVLANGAEPTVPPTSVVANTAPQKSVTPEPKGSAHSTRILYVVTGILFIGVGAVVRSIRREGAMGNIFVKLKMFDHPTPLHSMRLGYMLGGFAGVVFVPLLLTGLALWLFGYDPMLGKPHKTAGAVSQIWTVGGYNLVLAKGNRHCDCQSGMRSAHILLGNFFLIFILAHIFRIVRSRSYYGKRIKTWGTGIILLTVALIFYGTGTLLKWDREGYESFFQLAGSAEAVGQLGLNLGLKVFWIHLLFAPLLLLAFLGAHLFLVKFLGISPIAPIANEKPLDPKEPSVGFLTHLQALVSYGLIFIGIISVFAAFYTQAPLADSGTNLPSVPWPFLYLSPLGGLAVLALPLLLVVVLFVLPKFAVAEKAWDGSQAVFLSIVLILVVLSIIGAVKYGVTP